jgi:hypothetical protein
MILRDDVAKTALPATNAFRKFAAALAWMPTLPEW